MSNYKFESFDKILVKLTANKMLCILKDDSHPLNHKFYFQKDQADLSQ